MRSGKSRKKSERAIDEQPVPFALRLHDPQQLRIYAWRKTHGNRSSVFQYEVKRLLTTYLDSIGFHPDDETLQAILVEKGLVKAVPTRKSPSRRIETQPSLTQEDDDEFTM